MGKEFIGHGLGEEVRVEGSQHDAIKSAGVLRLGEA